MAVSGVESGAGVTSASLRSDAMATTSADAGSRVAGAAPEPGLTPRGTRHRCAAPIPARWRGSAPAAVGPAAGLAGHRGVVLVAALLRFYDLGEPTDRGTPVFDEKHYVPQAWDMVRNGGWRATPATRRSSTRRWRNS